MHTAHVLGKRGEDIASLYLQKSDYEVLERNRRFGREEIDIIAYDSAEQMIVFVEVKTRSHHSAAYPIHTSITPRKRASLRRAINRWIEEHQYDAAARIDLISIFRESVVEHLKDLGSEVSI